MDNKYGKLAFQIFSLVGLIAIGVCLICDFAVNKSLTWAGFPIVGILLSWTVTLPLMLARKNKIIFALAALTVAILPFLYLLECLTPVKGWFQTLSAPITLVSLVAIWLMYFALRFVKNKWYLSAIAVFLFGVAVSSAVKYFVSGFIGGSFISLDSAINLLACLAITALLVIIGRNKTEKREEPAALVETTIPEESAEPVEPAKTDEA